MNAPDRVMSAVGEPARTRRTALVAAVAVLLSASLPHARAQTSDEYGAASLRGAGSTFAHPLMSAWAREYRAVRTGGVAVPMSGSGLDDDIGGVALDYEAVGSQAGIQRVRTRAVDFAVSEMPLPAADLQRGGLVQVPLVAGAVAIAVNLDTQGREIRVSPALLADIYLGRVRTWNDPAITRLNPSLTLPATPITVVHRADGSGTTFTFTQFLEQTSPDWKSQVGSGLLVNWPAGTAQRGSAGVARLVAGTPGAIGYVDLVQARQARLRVASVQNPQGRFVPPDAAGVSSAVAAADWQTAGRQGVTLVNLGGERSYPIVAAVYGLAADLRGGARAAEARAFLDWSVTRGRTAAERLGYVALPAAAIVQVRAALR